MIQASLPPAIETLYRQLMGVLQSICMEGCKDIEKLLACAVFTAEEHLQKLYEFIPGEGFADPDEEILPSAPLSFECVWR